VPFFTININSRYLGGVPDIPAVEPVQAALVTRLLYIHNDLLPFSEGSVLL